MEDKERKEFNTVGPCHGVIGWAPAIPGNGQGVVESGEDRKLTAHDLVIAWKKYHDLFGVNPHGTLPQMRALISLVPRRNNERSIL